MINNFPDKVKGVFVPKDQKELKKLERISRTIERLNRKVDVKDLKSGHFLEELSWNTLTDED